MILRIFRPCQRPWSLVFGVGSRVCVCERRTGLKYWRKRCSRVRVHFTQFFSKKKNNEYFNEASKIKETVFERDNPVHDFDEDGNEGHAKGLLAMWCS